MSFDAAGKIILQQTIIPIGDEKLPDDVEAGPVEVTLENVIKENVDRMGHTGSHPLGVFVQLLTTGKVRFSFRHHTKRLEMTDKSLLMQRSDALQFVEACLTELRVDEAPGGMADFTQNIIIQAPNRKH
jgi:hypothetical protein